MIAQNQSSVFSVQETVQEQCSARGQHAYGAMYGLTISHFALPVVDLTKAQSFSLRATAQPWFMFTKLNCPSQLTCLISVHVAPPSLVWKMLRPRAKA